MKLKLTILACFCATALFAQAPKSITWDFSSYPEITEILGQPQVIETAIGPAVEFNGATDGVFTSSVPVNGMDEVTLEVIMNQYGKANFENRYLHMGELNGPRIMFETRVTPENTWYADFFVVMTQGRETALMIDEKKTHPCDQWYNVTLVGTKDGVKGYVNGVLEGEAPLNYRNAITTGQTSLGVRQNLRSWFKGAIYKVRVTNAALTPDQFLKDYENLNAK